GADAARPPPPRSRREAGPAHGRNSQGGVRAAAGWKGEDDRGRHGRSETAADELIHWFIGSSGHWIENWFIESLGHWVIGSRIGSSSYRVIGSLNWFIGSSSHRIIELVHRVIGSLGHWVILS